MIGISAIMDKFPFYRYNRIQCPTAPLPEAGLSAFAERGSGRLFEAIRSVSLFDFQITRE